MTAGAGGWQCPNCHRYVTMGELHQCSTTTPGNPIPPGQTFCFVHRYTGPGPCPKCFPPPQIELAEAIEHLANSIAKLAEAQWAQHTPGREWGPAEDLAARAEVARRDEHRGDGT